MDSHDGVMKRSTRLIASLSCGALLLGTGVIALRSLPFLPEVAARQLAADLESGSFTSQVWTDPESGGTKAGDRYQEIVSGLKDANVELKDVAVVSVDEENGVSRVSLEWTWESRDAASTGADWKYRTEAQLIHSDSLWKTDFGSELIHPDLSNGETLQARATAGERGRILGADDEALVSQGPVVDVGLHPSHMGKDSEGTYERLSDALDVDADALKKRVESADPEAFVPVITLREDDYQLVKVDIHSLPGAVFRERTQPLSRSKGFAAATLGSVGTATTEDIERDPDNVTEESEIGRSGIQAAFDKTLRPEAGLSIVAGELGADASAETVHSFGAGKGRDVRTTLDVGVQTAADYVVRKSEKPAAIVAVRPSDGHVLAVANHDPAGLGWDRALQGRYPPGSVFKIASGLAMLDRDVTASTVLDCPKTTNVHGKSFKNAEDHVLGSVPFEESFAESCNTAFVNSATDVSSADIVRASADLGMRSTDIGIDAFLSDVPEVGDPVEHAASMIGQGKVLASPLGVATMSASVAAGHTVAPILIRSDRSNAPATRDFDSEHLNEVRSMMRMTVTEGTASTLSEVLGKPVYGKTGTAEYGSEVPPRTHSWFAGFQGDLAVAVLVEDGGFGAEAAVPMAKRFFQEMNS